MEQVTQASLRKQPGITRSLRQERHERWGSDIEQAVQSVWLQLDCLSLANEAEVNPHRKGLIECREKLNAILGIEDDD